MRSSLQNSFYMGISYRPTHRPSPSHPLSAFSVKKSDQSNSIEEQKIIHKCKNNKRVKEILRHYNPYIVRKQCDLKNKKKKKQKSCYGAEEQIQQGKEEYFRVTKLEKNKTQASENLLDQNKNKFEGISVAITLPQKDKKKLIEIDVLDNKTSQLNAEKLTQTEPIFNHYPSQLFVSSTKSIKSPSKKNSVALKLNNFFFPSRRVKSQIIDNSNRSENKKIRPTSSHPRKKYSHDTRVFNFDGTLQNHKIDIPERPKTADHRVLNRQGEKKRVAEYLTFEQIAKRCVRLKKQRKAQIERDNKIQPWADEAENKNSIDLFEVSCSTIKCENSLQL